MPDVYETVLIFPPHAGDELPSVKLYIGDLQILDAPMSRWKREAGAEFHPGNSFCRHRLVSACQLLLQTEGAGFFDSQLKLTIAGFDPKGEEQFRIETPVSGSSLLEQLDLIPNETLDGLIDGAEARKRSSPADVKVIAFYLPQFYPFAENDRWWGEGFSEWSNVVDAKPQLEGHNMPLLPADLGFYDLRVEDTRRRQAQLASRYGVDAFCYYFYWFSGRRVMREVLDEILASGHPSTDFCLCWANESWSRRWDGSDGNVDLLISQKHETQTDVALLSELIPYFLDGRYVKIDGSPLLLVYRLDIIEDATLLIQGWRKAAVRAGLPGLFVAAVRSFGLKDEDAAAVDAIVDFPPHTAVSSEVSKNLPVNPDFNGRVFDYRQVVVESVTRKPASKLTFPGVMPRWDNTPRKSTRSHIFWNSTPSAFKLWVSLALQQTRQLPLGRRLLFINSWNEWGEGAMLEPDRAYGRSFLEALRSSRGGYIVGPSEIAKFALISNLPPSKAEEYLRNFSGEVQMVAQVMASQRTQTKDAFRSGAPEIVLLSDSAPAVRDGMMIIDHSLPEKVEGAIIVAAGSPWSIIGWYTVDKVSRPYLWGRVAYLVLTSKADTNMTFHVPINTWSKRNDIDEHFKFELDPDSRFFGFELVVSTDLVAPGEYSISALQLVEDSLVIVPCYSPFRKLG